MFTSRREQLGDSFLDMLGIDDSTPDPGIAAPAPVIQTTPFGTFNTPPAPIGGGSTVFNLPVGTSAIQPSGPTTLQSIAGATGGLTSILNSIGSLFSPKPTAVTPTGTVAPAAASSSTSGISLTTILLLAGAGVAVLAYTNKRRRSRRG